MASKISSWNALNRGDEVELLDHELVIARGVIDSFTDDREIIWLTPSYGGKPLFHPTFGGGRRMFHHADGWQIRIILPAAP